MQLERALSRSATFRINKAFHKMSWEHEMRWKLNAAELLIPQHTAPLWCFSQRTDDTASESISRFQENRICTCAQVAHMHCFCQVAVGGDLYPSPMGHLRPIWKQRGCTVTHTHTAELMEHPMLGSSDRLKVLNSCSYHMQGAGTILSASLFSTQSTVMLPWLYDLSLFLTE